MDEKQRMTFGTNTLEGFEHHAQVFKHSFAGSKELKVSEQGGA